MKKYLLLIILILVPLFFFKATTSYRMPADYNYDSDFGRDLWKAQEITQGNHTLVGPQFSFAGLRLSPYHFYFMAPFLWLFNSYKAVVIANGLLFVAALTLTFILISKAYGRLYSFLSIIWIATTSYIILAARSPGNAFTYLALYLIYFTGFFIAQSRGTWLTMALGFLGGVIVNYHPISVLEVVAPFLAKEIVVRDRFTKNVILSWVLYLSGFLATFIPVVLFELKHGFVLTKSFFGPRQGEFLSGEYLNSIGSLAHMVKLNDLSHTWIPITGLGVVAIIAAAYYEKKKPELKNWFAAVIIICLWFLIFGREVPHYFFPVILFLQLTAVFFIKDLVNSKIILIGLILTNLIFFPARFYKSSRNLGEVEKNFDTATEQLTLPGQSLNTILVNSTHLSAPGYEYRYLLTKQGYKVDDEYSYNLSRNLLVVSELGEVDFKNSKNWGLTEFGKKRLIQRTKVDGTVYYLFEKSQ